MRLLTAVALGILLGRLTSRPRIRRLTDNITATRALLRAAQHAGNHDSLTGLPNRSCAEQFYVQRAEIDRHPTVLALVDLDRFKTFNDTYGHHVGDTVIRTAADRLSTIAQEAYGFAARLSGDEFLLVLPAAEITAVTEALDHLTDPATLYTDDGEITVRLQASAGITVNDGTDLITFADMLHRADIALHHAKHRRGTCVTYEPRMRMPRNAERHGPRRRDQHPTA
ncbi:hypothetical protein GCM10010112_82700 [Actinoplanes lobatus]|uniref:Diguanylate cyclase (GGDEF)-like protein n=1 Tax=Actinoplanes lobatus TaxID=113568 RepID=A0A7W7HLR3_9ACTN|nr:GGDEF domain-containing protein [Actinoplanes lobatus]MBB4752542.1 diguanylate cyclase (GGDEF)-like protein [Actinoplanes lobatus]GGN93905.1 hypothetical protein GCM10010112_82700 [Actinoplanes lobatus]GIE44841.1 hypothetical protein Alo02nite_77390 [Actinoplanes lobatus]